MPALALTSTLSVLDTYGSVAPTTATAPLRQSACKFGDGVFVEEATTNLITNPGFGTGTTKYTTVNGSSVALSSTRALFGTQSLAVTVAALTAGQASTGYNIASGDAANSTTYTASCWVWVPVGMPAVEISAQGAWVTSSVFGATSTVTGQWQRLSVTFTTTASGSTSTGVIYLLAAGTTTAGQVYWTDSWQLEAKSYATTYCDGSLGTGYAWTGAANASTSTRAAGVLVEPLSVAPSTSLISLACWARIGYLATGNQQALMVVGATDNDSFRLAIGSGAYQVFKIVGGTAVSAAAGGSATAGDLVFLGATFDGATLKHYASVNGAAMVSASTATVTASSTPPTNVALGSSIAQALQGDSVIEQALVFNALLTGTDMTNLATAAGPTGYADDSRIVLAAATGLVRGSTSAATAAGTGSYRIARTVSCYAEAAPVSSSDPDLGTATVKISVPAGSGIGQGQKVSLSGLTSVPLTVQRVFSPGGAYDELLAA